MNAIPLPSKKWSVMANKSQESILFQVKLIAIDSIAFPFKDGVTTKQRTGLLFRQLADLQRITLQNQIAVSRNIEIRTYFSTCHK